MNKHFVITISRNCGSGGSIIGDQVAKELGISYIDRQLLTMASEQSGISESLFAQADEKLKKSFLTKVTQNVYKGELHPPENDEFTSNKNLFNYQAKVLKELATEQSYVVIGRCSDFILKDMKNLLRVYIHAPHDECVRKCMSEYMRSEREMEKHIQKTDKVRAEYYLHYTGKKWNDPANYDLCLNSLTLGYDGCVEVICQTVKRMMGQI